jgi:DNA polymerase-3 subunit delta
MKEKYIQEFPLLVGIKLQTWIGQECKKRGGSISPHAAAYIVQNIGGEVWLLHSLINQLVAYKNTIRIEQPDVELFLDEKGSETIFNAIDAVAEGNIKKAFVLLQAQRQEGQEEGFIFNMLLRQFKILLQIKDLIDRENPSPDTMAKMLGLAPFVVKKSAGVAKRFTMSQLEKRYCELMQIDVGMKTGFADQGILIDRFVAAA